MQNIGAVDVGRLVAFLIDASNRRNIYNRGVAHPLPHIDCRDEKPPYRSVRVNVDGLSPNEFKDCIHNAVFIIENIESQHSDDDPRYKIRQKNRGLGEFLENDIARFVDEDSQNDRHRLQRYQIYKVVCHRVERHVKAGTGQEEKAKIFEPDPRASKDAQVVFKIFECQDYARHGHIIQGKHKYYGGRQQNKQSVILFQFVKKTLHISIAPLRNRLCDNVVIFSTKKPLH